MVERVALVNPLAKRADLDELLRELLAREAGLAGDRIRELASSEEAGPPVRALVGAGDWVLVKGSRAMRMERVARHLEAEAGT